MIAAAAAQRVHSLLVDDDEDHAEIVRIVFDHCHHNSTLSAVLDGREALRFLRREQEHAGAARVDVLLLDISMPGMSGLDELREIRADPRLRALPVVIFTSSEAGRDVAAAYEASANSYVVKPKEYNAFRRVIEQIDTFWGGCNILPTHADT